MFMFKWIKSLLKSNRSTKTVVEEYLQGVEAKHREGKDLRGTTLDFLKHGIQIGASADDSISFNSSPSISDTLQKIVDAPSPSTLQLFLKDDGLSSSYSNRFTIYDNRRVN